MDQEIQGSSLLIDANIFLEFLLEQERASASLALLKEVEEDKRAAYVATFALHSIEVILDRYEKPTTLKKFLFRVAATQGLTVYPTSTEEEQQIVSLTQKLPLDFDDALHYYVARSLDLTLVSFDHDFDQTDLRRVEPSQIL